MSRNDYDDADPEGPGPEDLAELDRDDDDDDGEGRACPSCRRELYAGAPKCPYCGDWIDADTPAGRRSHQWMWPAVVALLVATILVMWHGLGR